MRGPIAVAILWPCVLAAQESPRSLPSARALEDWRAMCVREAAANQSVRALTRPKLGRASASPGAAAKAGSPAPPTAIGMRLARDDSSAEQLDSVLRGGDPASVLNALQRRRRELDTALAFSRRELALALDGLHQVEGLLGTKWVPEGTSRAATDEEQAYVPYHGWQESGVPEAPWLADLRRDGDWQRRRFRFESQFRSQLTREVRVVDRLIVATKALLTRG